MKELKVWQKDINYYWVVYNTNKQTVKVIRQTYYHLKNTIGLDIYDEIEWYAHLNEAKDAGVRILNNVIDKAMKNRNDIKQLKLKDFIE